MGADRVRGQLQPPRDLIAASALDQEKQDVLFTRCERREQVIAVATVVLILDEPLQDRAKVPGRQPALAADDAADDGKQISTDSSFLTHAAAPARTAATIRSGSDDTLSMMTRGGSWRRIISEQKAMAESSGRSASSKYDIG